MSLFGHFNRIVILVKSCIIKPKVELAQKTHALTQATTMTQALQQEVATLKFECEALLHQIADANQRVNCVIANSRKRCTQLEKEADQLRIAKATLEHAMLTPNSGTLSTRVIVTWSVEGGKHG